jgi:hypothetical protein
LSLYLLRLYQNQNFGDFQLEKMTMRSVFLLKESPGCQMDRSDPAPGGECGLLSAKGGLMMGTKKVGTFSSPRKKAKNSITRKKSKRKKYFQ